MSPLLKEFLDATVPVPTLNKDERAVQGLRGMAPDEWVMVTLRDAGPDTIELTELFVPTEWRGRGFGRLALEYVTALADKHGCRITSYVLPFGYKPSLNRHELAAWYRRHGFVVRRDGSMQRDVTGHKLRAARK